MLNVNISPPKVQPSPASDTPAPPSRPPRKPRPRTTSLEGLPWPSAPGKHLRLAALPDDQVDAGFAAYLDELHDRRRAESIHAQVQDADWLRQQESGAA